MKTLKTVVVLALVFALGCSKDDPTGWYLDASFSVQLVTFNKENPVFVTQDPANAIEVLQIFRAERFKDTLDTVTDIRSKLLVYETRTPEDIRSLFRASRIQTQERCDSIRGDYEFVILGFDRDLMRVGYIKYYPCERDDNGWFTTWGSKSMYFSSELAKVINKIIPLGIQKKGR